jgi:hypothetical protein
MSAPWGNIAMYLDHGDAGSAWRISAELAEAEPEISDFWYDIFLDRLQQEREHGKISTPLGDV